MFEWLKSGIEKWSERREARQARRCAAGKHHWKSISDQVRCWAPGCGKRYYG